VGAAAVEDLPDTAPLEDFGRVAGSRAGEIHGSSGKVSTDK
jgi:hypothetical protein